MHLLRITDLSVADIHAIWDRAEREDTPRSGTVAWSFEGKGIRTRTTFMAAFRALGLDCTELPDLLKTAERPCDLAGYLDDHYALYVIRESNHARLAELAQASRRPVINAMSALEHPCEVLADAGWIHRHLKPIDQARICLWGPSTNVFRSWHGLAQVLGLQITQVCPAVFHETQPQVRFCTEPPSQVDVVITDAWPAGTEHAAVPLTEAHLVAMNHPALLPTPPFSIGRELAFDPVLAPGFVGYAQKRMLMPMQRALIAHLLDRASAQ